MRHLLTSKTFIAFVLFGALSLAAWTCSFGKTAPADFPYLSWTGWAIKDFLSQAKAPNIVFLGSSLMLVPLDGVDADYLKERVDGSQHHCSLYFERKLEALTGIKARTFTFALPGEMPSDAYLITRFLLNGKHRPDVIVYGVGPRDFMDNMLPSPSATDPYRFLSRFGEVEAPRFMPDLVDRFNHELGQFVYLYGTRGDLSDVTLRALSTGVGQLLPLPQSAVAKTFDERRLLVPDYRPYELQKGQAFFRPSTPEDWSKFADNLEEYKKRYKRLKWDTLLSQMSFLADTIDSANKVGTKVVIVAMPITDLNRQLLSDFSWTVYRDSLKALAQRKGALLVDFSESSKFQRSDFGDTVHLHSGGGKKLLDLIADRVAASQSILSAIDPSTKKDAANLAHKGGPQL